MTYVDRRKNNPLPQWQQSKTGDAMSRLDELMALADAHVEAVEQAVRWGSDDDRAHEARAAELCKGAK